MGKKTKELLSGKFKLSPASYELLMYLVTGVLTTIISVVSFYLFEQVIGCDYRVANFISWVISVLFAYFSSRALVFNSQQTGFKAISRELVAFTGFRVLSFVIDLVILIVLVEKLQLNSLVAKIITNIIVLVLNYLFSKLFVFKK